MISAESCVFDKQSQPPVHCGLPLRGRHPFFRSYGIILPSSLANSHSRALVFSTRPPVSDYGTVKLRSHYEGFLGRVVGSLLAGLPAMVSAFGLTALRIFLENHPYHLSPAQPFAGRLTFLRHSLMYRPRPGSGILTGCPSSTPFGLDLGPTNPELTNIALGNLRLSATRILTLFIATYSGILTSQRSSTPYGMPSVHCERSPTPHKFRRTRTATNSVACLAPSHFLRRFARLVSCYALFKGWLLLSQPPRCLSKSTSFTT